MRAIPMILLAWGCAAAPSGDDTDVAGDTPDTGVGPAVTYHRDVRPLLAEHCEGCHQAGGIGPFSMTYTAEDWVDGNPSWVPLAVASALVGSMPPWMPDDDCHPIEHARRLAPEHKDLLRTWSELGFPEGRPEDATAPAQQVPDLLDVLGPPSARLTLPEPYTADRSAPDDYRCFPLPLEGAGDRWMSAFTVEPDARDVVHHVILYRLDAEWADDVATWDAEDEGPGYTCFGSPGTWKAETFAGWAPGAAPEIYDAGTARKIPDGSVLVLQVHYNTLNVPPEQPIPADASSVVMWTLPPGEMPSRRLLSVPLAKTDLLIPEGAPEVVQTEELALDWLPQRLPIRGVFPHMHQLATSMRVEVIDSDDRERCVVDIPKWDFAWQQAYFFGPDDAIGVGWDDRLRITCTYDNSAANQPVVNGLQQDPREVAWGDGSLDEMCLAYLYVTCPAVDCPLDRVFAQ